VKPIRHYPSHLRHVATPSTEIKNSIFFADFKNRLRFDKVTEFKGGKLRHIEDVVSKADVEVCRHQHTTATGNHMSYGITQCYLPPSSGYFLAFTSAEAGTRFSDPGGMKG